MSGSRQQLTDAACQSMLPPVCVRNQTHLFFIPVKARTWTSMSGTRQYFTDAACTSIIPSVCVWFQTQLFLSLSKPVRGPPYLEPDNISRMRPVKAKFLLLCLLTPLSALQDIVRKAWFPIAARVQVMGDKAVAAVDGLEKRGLPVKLHFWKCIEGLIPPDLEEFTQYMGSSNVSLPMITKKAKQLKGARLWEHHLCHPDNDLVDPSRKTLEEWASCEQSLLSKTDVTFKTYDWKWSEKNCWPPWKYVVNAAIWSDPTYAPLRDAVKRPLVNPEVKIAADVNFVTVDIGSEAPEAGVTDSKYLLGWGHAYHWGGIWYAAALYGGQHAVLPDHCIHSVVSRHLVSGTLVLIVSSACDVLGVLDDLRKLQDNEGLTTICVACFIPGSLTEQYSMGFAELWIVSKDPLPKKVLPSASYLLPAATVTLGAPLNPKLCLEPDTYEAECVLRRVHFSVGYASCVWNQTTVCDYCPCAAGFGEICLFPDKLQYFSVCRTNFDENGMRQRVVPPPV